MRRAGALALLCLVLALLLGLQRAQQDMRDELADAVAGARLTALLSGLSTLTDDEALARVAALQPARDARHLHLEVRDAQGRERLAAPAPPADAWPMRAALALNQRLFPPPPSQRVEWSVARPDGTRWQLALVASSDREQREALSNWLAMFGVLLLGCAGLLAVMRWSLAHSFAPLARLLAAIGALGDPARDAPRAIAALPAMPVRELEAIAQALRRLAASLDEAQAARRVLAQQVFSLQEDERTRLARELHDEFGQRLTALRADAAWLARRNAHDAEAASVIEGMSAQCRLIHDDIRALLARLRPLPLADDGRGEAPARLAELLESLSRSGSPAADRGLALDLAMQRRAADGSVLPWPTENDEAAPRLPRALVLALYRASQEALTNAARHAQARRVRLALTLEDAAGAASPRLRWSVRDDGIGLADISAMRQGTGLASLQERIWSLGGELRFGPGLDGRGLGLEATLPLAAGAEVAR
ncbi:sensor histidine kinase [Caldimonas sp. KR1-144]|uniref:sensor histidine kinase n=1 Tax=Caldimonas sp. KR1-144 TaxID=3400911 RepID=UPI003C0E1607